jgi:UDPglucose 6-dehydrogenase
VGEQLGPHFTVIVNKSTVPIGSGNWVGSLVRERIQRNGSGNPKCFAVASNPEFLREGSAIHDTLYPDRVVVGADQPKTAEVL